MDMNSFMLGLVTGYVTIVIGCLIVSWFIRKEK